jgi:ABC-type branched-subunit amino acid transport system substrate-binding protein
MKQITNLGQRSIVMLSALVLLALITSALYLLEQYAAKVDVIRAAEQRRVDSLKTADLLRQTSDDLTRMARTYVVTGESRYEEYFKQILAIRKGEMPRPVNYGDVYWDYVVSTGRMPREDGPPVSLEEIMRQQGFSSEEFNLLNQARQRSDKLALLEVRAMNVVKGYALDSSGNYVETGKPDFELAQRLLHGKEYHAEKLRIMELIDRVARAVDTRTQEEIEYLETEAGRLATLSLTLGTGSFIFVLLLLALAVRRINNDNEHGSDVQPRRVYRSSISRTAKFVTAGVSVVIVAVLFVIFLTPDSREFQGLDISPNDNVIGITDNEILLGSSAALTGHAGFLGTQYTHGALSWFNEVNAAGGIHGRKIRLISYDDQYDPPQTVENTEKLIGADRVFMLFGYVGTPTSVKIIDAVHEHQVPAFGFLTGAESLRTPFRPYMFHVRTSYYEEVEAALAYFVDKLGLSKIGVVYQDDAFGKAVLSGVQLAIWRRHQESSRDLEIVATDTYTRGTMDVEPALESLKNSGAEAVIMVGTYDPLARFIKLSVDNGFTPYFHTVSFIGSGAFAEAIKKTGVSTQHYEKIIVTQVVPSPSSAGIEVVDQYRTLHARYFPDDLPNYVALEGFVNAQILVEALKRAGPDLSRTQLISTLEEMENEDVGLGNKLTFGKFDHSGLSGVYYSRLDVGNGNFEIFGLDE